MKKFGVFLLLLMAAITFGGFLVFAPFGPHTETFVDIPSGTGALDAAKRLEDHGILRSRYAFDLLRVTKGGRLLAGEYRFDHPASAADVYARLARGDVYTRTVVIPEGFNIFDIARAIEQAGLGSAADFLAATHTNTALTVDLVGNTRPTSLEGFLFPDTYRFSRHATGAQMVTTMVRRFRQKTLALGLGANAFRTVTMASVIEKEVGQSSERTLVASVFENRLRQDMPLQTDPTVIYAALLAGRYRGTIYASDLHADSPYNTYAHRGLPPGPICSPGLASLRAALHPASTEYLYFVSDAAGHSVFSRTLAEHATHVAELRRAQSRERAR